MSFASTETNVAGAQLLSIVQRIEQVEAEIKDLNDGKKEIYAEAKSSGFDTKGIKQVVSARRKDASERAEEESIFDLYWRAIEEAGTGLARVQAHEQRAA